MPTPAPCPQDPRRRPRAPRRTAGRLLAAALAAVLALPPATGRAQPSGAQSPGAQPPGTLFADLGGHDGLARIISDSMQAWLADDRIRATFSESDIPRLRRLLYDQLCHISGGGCDYRGQDMAKAHRGLHLHDSQFNALAEDMQTAMDRLGIPSSTQNRLVALLAPMQRDVVTR